MRKLYAVLGAFVLAGCGGGGGGNGFAPIESGALLAPAECLARHVNVLTRLVERMQDLADVLNGSALPAGVTQSSATEYSMSIDLENDGTPEITMDVTIVGGSDVSDGFDDDESITLNLVFQGVIDGTATGINFNRLSSDVSILLIAGPISLDDGAGCTLSSGSFNVNWPLGNVGGAFPNFVFSSSDGASSMTGTMFLDDDSELLLVNATLDGADVFLAIDLDTFQVFEEAAE